MIKMQFQHVNFLKAHLESLDEDLEQYEMRLKLEGGSREVFKLIKELRNEIHKFYAYIGVSIKKKSIYKEINTKCNFFDVDLTEMEPKRFQKGYGNGC